MKHYILYLLTAVTNYWLIMFLWGVSAGFASYFPIIAVIGSILLFTVAAPILALKFKIGLIAGVICSLIILPYNIGYLLGIIEDKNYHDVAGILSALPSLLNIMTIIITLLYLYKKEGTTGTKVNRIVLAAIPPILFVIYAISIWEYIS